MNDRRKPAQAIDPSQPGIYLTYGSSPKHFRPLDRDLILIGNAPACDIGMEGVGVFPVHCIITRGSDGFYVRNCAGRASTRLNGSGIQEAQLHDTDLLQVGPFVLEMHLPPTSLLGNVEDSVIVVDEIKLRHMQRSRRHLAQLALAQRRRLHAERTFGHNEHAKRDLAIRQLDLNRQAEALRNQLYDSEQCVRRIDQAEQRLTAERDVLNQERAALQARVLQAEQELEKRREAVEAEVWQQQVKQAEENERQLARERETLRQERTALQERRLQFEQGQQQLSAERQALQKERQTFEELVRSRQQADTQGTRERELLKQEQSALQARAEQLEQAEQKMAAATGTFEREKAAWQARVEQIKGELEKKRRAQEADLRAREEECQRLMEQVKKAQAEQMQAAQPAAAPVSEIAQEEAWRLAIRQRELYHYARHLKRSRQRLQQTAAKPSPDVERQMDARRQEIEQYAQLLHQNEQRLCEQAEQMIQERDRLAGEVRELEQSRKQWAGQMEQTERQQAETAARMAKEGEEFEQEKAALREKHMELVHTLSELKEMHQNLVAEHRAEQESFQRQNAQLKQQLAERDNMLQELAGGPAGAENQLEELQRELTELGKQLEQKDALILALRGESSGSLALPSSTGDTASYEIELNLFRRQLETDRRALNAEIRQVQARKAELDESVRETELELSRERAALARERGWLDRIRDEVRIELERVRREGDMRERLEPYQRLADSERHHAAADQGPVANKTSTKLAGLLNRLSKPLHGKDEG